MKKLFALLITCLILFAFGCSDDDDSVTNGDNTVVKHIIPMAVGNQWTGVDTMFNADDSYNSHVLHQYRLEKDTTVLNSTWYIMEISRIPQTSRDYHLYQSSANGSTWLLYDYVSNPTQGTLWLKHPATADEQYMTGITGNDSVTVTHIDTSITVPDSTFSCYRYKVVYHDNGDRHEDYYYMAPNAGYVITWRIWFEITSSRFSDSTFCTEACDEIFWGCTISRCSKEIGPLGLRINARSTIFCNL